MPSLLAPSLRAACGEAISMVAVIASRLWRSNLHGCRHCEPLVAKQSPWLPSLRATCGEAISSYPL